MTFQEKHPLDDALTGYAERCKKAVDKSLANQLAAILKAVEGRKVELARRLATTVDRQTVDVIRGKLSGLTDATDAIKEAGEA